METNRTRLCRSQLMMLHVEKTVKAPMMPNSSYREPWAASLGHVQPDKCSREPTLTQTVHCIYFFSPFYYLCACSETQILRTSAVNPGQVLAESRLFSVAALLLPETPICGSTSLVPRPTSQLRMDYIE